MVAHIRRRPIDPGILSVLALSSRFDGPDRWRLPPPVDWPFSTRSVESF